MVQLKQVEPTPVSIVVADFAKDFDIPHAPKKPTLKAKSFQTVTLEIGQINNSYVTGLVVEFTNIFENSTAQHFEAEPFVKSIMVPDLKPHTGYRMTVQYKTEFGLSPPSEAIVVTTPAAPGLVHWHKVFSHDTTGGMFSGAEQLNKNPKDPGAKLFSILGDLEKFKADGHFHLKLCYPKMVLEEGYYIAVGGCNEWIQTSNPATEKKVDGFRAIQLSFPKKAHKQPWGGLALSSSNAALMDQSPGDNGAWWMAVGATWSDSKPPSFPGPFAFGRGYMVHKVEMFVKIP
jgi:hypothetical protein